MSISDEELDAGLERLRDAREMAPAHLVGRIMANLDGAEDLDPFERLLRWLTASYARGALAIAAPLALGIALGTLAPTEADYEAELLAIAEQGSIVFVDSLMEYENDEI